MKPILAIILMTFLVWGSALAQTDAPTAGCDKVLDITDADSQSTPLVLNAGESLCLDSQQVATWFVDQGGWESVLSKDKRYWQLTPPGPTRAVFTLHLPSGDKRKLRVLVDPDKIEPAETEPTAAEPAETKEKNAENESPQN